MELRFLEEFVAFSESLNYSATARKLFISQPSLSQHLAKMEAELGFKLISRGPHNPRLTTAGNIFLVQAKLILQAYEDTLKECLKVDMAEKQAIRIIDLRAFLRQSDLAERGGKTFNATYVPFIDVCDLDEYKVLDENLVDISFTYSPEPTLRIPEELDQALYEGIPLASENMLVKIPKLSSLHGVEPLHMSDLEGRTVVENGYGIFRRSENSVREICNKTNTKMNYVGGSYQAKNILLQYYPEYIAFWSESSYAVHGAEIDPHCDFVKLADSEVAVYPFAIYRKDNENPLLKLFIKHVRASLEAEAMK